MVREYAEDATLGGFPTWMKTVEVPEQITHSVPMSNLLEIQEAADQLSTGEQAELINHLLSRLPSAPSGPDELEAARRDSEMDNGTVRLMGHSEFLAAVGRR